MGHPHPHPLGLAPRGAVAKGDAAWLREEIARILAEYEIYLAEYGSFAEAVRSDAEARDDDGERVGRAR